MAARKREGGEGGGHFYFLIRTFHLLLFSSQLWNEYKTKSVLFLDN